MKTNEVPLPLRKCASHLCTCKLKAYDGFLGGTHHFFECGSTVHYAITPEEVDKIRERLKSAYHLGENAGKWYIRDIESLLNEVVLLYNFRPQLWEWEEGKSEKRPSAIPHWVAIPSPIIK